MQGTGDLRFGPPTPPPSPVYKPKAAWDKLQVSLYNPKTLLAGSATQRENNPAMQYEIHTSATITDRIQPSFNLRQTRLKISPPPPPSPPPNKFQGWENDAFWLLRGFILGVEWAILSSLIMALDIVHKIGLRINSWSYLFLLQDIDMHGYKKANRGESICILHLSTWIQ